MDNLYSRNLTESSAPLFIEASRFRRNLGSLFLFSLPVIYLGIILAVTIHEVLGHGLTAALLGGRFNGFGILLDGMGWADVEMDGLPELSKAFVFFAGAFYTTVFSLLFFALSTAYKRKPILRLAFLYFAITSLLDGLPYFFWDAIYLGGIGDFSMIWFLYHSHGLRIAVIVLCGLLMVIGIIFFNMQYYKVAYSWLGEGKPIQLKGKIIFSLVIFALQAMGWFSFDWNQLIPGVGLLPSVFALVIVLVTLILLIVFYEIKSFKESGHERSGAKMPIYLAWGVCMAVVFLIGLWVQNGIHFP